LGYTLALEDDRVVEVVRGASQVGEVRHAPAGQYRHQADAGSPPQSEQERRVDGSSRISLRDRYLVNPDFMTEFAVQMG
jgi:hypothetical protein